MNYRARAYRAVNPAPGARREQERSLISAQVSFSSREPPDTEGLWSLTVSHAHARAKFPRHSEELAVEVEKIVLPRQRMEPAW